MTHTLTRTQGVAARRNNLETTSPPPVLENSTPRSTGLKPAPKSGSSIPPGPTESTQESSVKGAGPQEVISKRIGGEGGGVGQGVRGSIRGDHAGRLSDGQVEGGSPSAGSQASRLRKRWTDNTHAAGSLNARTAGGSWLMGAVMVVTEASASWWVVTHGCSYCCG